jgi:hypothetical protein
MFTIWQSTEMWCALQQAYFLAYVVQKNGMMMAWEVPKHVTQDTGTPHCVFQNKELCFDNRIPSYPDSVSESTWAVAV